MSVDVMKKRVLIVNKFYYPRGGDCVCAINLENLLRSKGHEVAVFAMQYDENIPSAYSSYFAENVGFSEGVSAKLNAAKRVFGFGSVKDSFARILADFKPDVVHLHNIHSYLSPVVAKMAKRAGAKVVWTMHDYKLLCPSYACLRNDEPCELCYNDKKHVLKNKCMKGSTVASVIAYMEAEYWHRKKLEKYTDTFVCPSRFMASKMQSGGFGKLTTVCNFIDPVKLNDLNSLPADNRQDYCVYVGRLSKEKGVGTLLAAIKECGRKIKIAGGGPLADEFRKLYGDCGNIEFLGHQDAKSVAKLLSEARFSVVPSEWYENNPLSVIESLCAGTPVVGSNMGGIPELLDESRGIIFDAKDKAMLKTCIEDAWSREWDNESIKESALREFSPDAYYGKIIAIYGA